MEKDSKFTRDENGYIAIRTVSAPYSSGTDDKDSMFTRDEDGYVAVRTIGGSGGGGGDQHNLGYYATPTALREAHPTAEDGDFAVVGSTDTVWVWDSDTTAWKDSGVRPTNNYEDLTNKPQINGVTLSGNKSKADLGITDNKAIEIASNTTVEGFSVPNPTAEELTAVYNAVVAGHSVQMVDSNDVYYQVLQADSVNDAINIEILYFSEMSLLYTLENDTVSIESKKLGGGLPDQTGNAGKFLTTDGTDASWSDKPLVNTATGNWAFAVGPNSLASAPYGLAIGRDAKAIDGWYSMAIGQNAGCTASRAIQLGGGTNTEDYTFKVGLGNGQGVNTNYTLLNGVTGTIPTARLTKVNSTITLTAAGWSSNTQTVTVNGVTSTSVVLVAPAPSDTTDYVAAGILCTSQTTDSLTFTATTTPTNDIDVNIVCL